MLEWIIESNEYEEIHKAYFGNCEITILKFVSGGYSAWVRKVPSVATIFKKNYDYKCSMEEVKEDFLKSFREFLDERTTYWMTLQHDFWKEEQWLDEEDE